MSSHSDWMLRQFRAIVCCLPSVNVEAEKKKCILCWKLSQFTTQIIKPFSWFSLANALRWRMTALNYHLVAGGKKEHHPVLTLQHSGQFHSLGTKKSQLQVQNVWNYFHCLSSYVQSWHTPAPTEPCPPCKKTVVLLRGRVSALIQRKADRSTLGRGWISIQIPDIWQRRKDVKSKPALWTLSKGGGEASF